MNLKSLALTFIALLACNSNWAQNFPKDTLRYEIIYDYSYQINKEDTLSKQKEQMTLLLAKKFSYYLSLNQKKLFDLANNYNDSQALPERGALPRPKINHTIVKDYGTDQTIFSDRFGASTYCFSVQKEDFKWKLINEQKVILGYVCDKATTTYAGREYVAWYTKEISVPDGPYKFQGLPGLILSVYDSNKQFQFTVFSIKNSSVLCNTADQVQKSTPITFEEYSVLKKRYREKPSLFINTGGMTFPQEFLDKADQRAKDKMKYENNPMELNE